VEEEDEDEMIFLKDEESDTREGGAGEECETHKWTPFKEGKFGATLQDCQTARTTSGTYHLHPSPK
jgi:hypothetical protein